ncbi:MULTISPECIES: hypothetical protein [Elizabethkingia]|uniref:hypothetical protein n=1 Tax=Elizabethkingia TaxID=308865 RepID=UPI00099AEFE3|nr:MULTISPECIES: hypothetical protein [Elizabethkingia]AQX90608.1 hypothetical protein AYC67_17010 [Elizabethkingia anophelis]EHM7981759.1 hypothetical protein [Elizabethkingia anophelis]EHM8032257.1 hypothetical protein [Elizabethkingia anophelis]EHZ9535211.1 hypothetical protein [Elizabethkingia anophelis]EKU3673121.1 hypothetical protein [Elizabethkingia anophelis]
MKHKIIKPDKDFELEIQAQKSEHKLHRSDDEIDKANIYWLACVYSNPFMPMVDLSFAFDELKKMLKEWLGSRKKSIIYKNKTNETI